MSLPALRKPKGLLNVQIPATNKLPKKRSNAAAEQNLIVTLKEGTKLVLTNDAYNGILNEGDVYKCVLCSAEMQLDAKLKDIHVKSAKHTKAMETLKFSDDFPGNMIRQVGKDTFYCTVCNVLVSEHYITRHVSNVIHMEELGKAVNKTFVYKPVV